MDLQKLVHGFAEMSLQASCAEHPYNLQGDVSRIVSANMGLPATNKQCQNMHPVLRVIYPEPRRQTWVYQLAEHGRAHPGRGPLAKNSYNCAKIVSITQTILRMMYPESCQQMRVYQQAEHGSAHPGRGPVR
jgi:hypothetical protein